MPETTTPAEDTQVEPAPTPQELIEARRAEIDAEVGTLSLDELTEREAAAREAWTTAKAEAKTIQQLADVRAKRAELQAWGDHLATATEMTAEALADVPETIVDEAPVADEPTTDDNAEPAAETDTVDATGETEVVAEDDAVAVAAALNGTSTRTVTDADRKVGTQTVAGNTARTLAPIVAAHGEGPDMQLGTQPLTFDSLLEKANHVLTRSGSGRKHYLAAIDVWTDDQRKSTLTGDADRNMDILFPDGKNNPFAAAIDCGPTEYGYEIPECYSASTPLWDNSNRRPIKFGKFSAYRPMSLADVASATTVNPTAGQDKPAYTIANCIEPIRPVGVVPIVGRVKVPNDFTIGSPFAVQSIINLAEADLARNLEQFILSAYFAQSKNWSAPGWVYGLSVELPVKVAQMMAYNHREPRRARAPLTLVVSPGLPAQLEADEHLRGVEPGSTMRKILETNGISGMQLLMDYDICVGQPPVPAALACPDFCDPQATDPPACATFADPDAATVGLGFFDNEFIGLVPVDEFATAMTGEIASGLDDTDNAERGLNQRSWFQEAYYLPPVHIGCTLPQFMQIGDAHIDGSYPAGINITEPVTPFGLPAGPTAVTGTPAVGSPCQVDD